MLLQSRNATRQENAPGRKYLAEAEPARGHEYREDNTKSDYLLGFLSKVVGKFVFLRMFESGWHFKSGRYGQV